MSAKKLVLGIEGGGTKTEWVTIDSGLERIAASGSLPAANLRLISDEALLQIFNVLPRDPTHVGVFLAGCVNEADRSRLRALAERCWHEARIVVGSDRDSGFATAFRDRDGITVIAGTGSAVTGRRGGRMEKAGGWGQLLGDKGGGYNLAVLGLRHVLSSYDIDHRITPLAQSVLRMLALNRLEDLVSWATNADKMSVAKLAPVVFEAAQRGDAEMAEAVRNGARTLAEFTCAVARRLDFDAPEVRLLGGLFVNHREYLNLFNKYVTESLPRAQVSLCEDSGAMGAAWLAADCGFRDFGKKGVEKLEAGDHAQLAAAMTEQRNPRSEHLDQMTTAEMVELFTTEENFVVAALDRCRDLLAAAVDLTSSAVQSGGRLFYVGAGTSGRLGVLDASEIPPTFGAPPELVQGIIAGGVRALYTAVEGAEDQAELGALTMAERGLNALDVVCGIAASGRTPFVLGALRRAKEIGAKTILLTCNPARTKSDAAWDVEIDLATGPELVTGSTRLKAGTATKVALNILSTCTMVRLGKVRGNLMIDVHASNAKLRDRAIRLVVQVRGCSYREAHEMLSRHDWNVRACLRENASDG